MKSDSLSLKAYTEIRKKILSQQIAPDTRLKEDDWAGKMDVSRMAIREALNRLLGEGLVTTGIKGGYFVKPATYVDMKLIREVREILEVGALKLAIKKITPEQILELESICNDFTMMVKQGYLSGACEADMKFHETLIKCAHNPKLASVYAASHIPLFHQQLRKTLGEFGDYDLTDAEHRNIVSAIKQKDISLAEQTLVAHFERGIPADEQIE